MGTFFGETEFLVVAKVKPCVEREWAKVGGRLM
jgi:hypothetical protein